MMPDRDFEPITTDRLVLRRSHAGDAAAISAYRSEPEVHRYQGWERTDHEGVHDEIAEMALRAPGEPGGWVQLSVEQRDTGRLVGDVGLSLDEHEPGVVKIGYTMDPGFQGRGYATEAVAALVDYAFEGLGAAKVRAFASAENLASIRVAEKVGLRLVERFERTYDGETWQGVRFEIARSERPR